MKRKAKFPTVTLKFKQKGVYRKVVLHVLISVPLIDAPLEGGVYSRGRLLKNPLKKGGVYSRGAFNRSITVMAKCSLKVLEFFLLSLRVSFFSVRIMLLVVLNLSMKKD